MTRVQTLFRLGRLGAAGLLLLAGCRGAGQDRVQGYVEGEFVYVASPLAGALQTLYVKIGRAHV